MKQLTMILSGAAALVTGLVPEAPVQAQASGNIAEIIVYGADPCPRSTDDQVVVCARRPESERYRIPEKYRQTGPRQSREAWANRAKQLETVGNTGVNSCSPVGPAGYSGCLTQVIQQARQDRKQQAEEGTAPDQ